MDNPLVQPHDSTRLNTSYVNCKELAAQEKPLRTRLQAELVKIREKGHASSTAAAILFAARYCIWTDPSFFFKIPPKRVRDSSPINLSRGFKRLFKSPKWLFHGYINMLEAWKEQTLFSSSLPSQRVSHSLKSEPLNSLAV